MVAIPAAKSYVPRSIKRDRRTRAEMEALRDALYRTLEADHPQTCRGVFYQLVSQGVIPKSEQDYKGIVIRLLVELRRSGRVPWGWIADNTRWMRGGDGWGNMEDALQDFAAQYRKALWRDQGLYVEVWCEKDALAGVLLEETARWRVPLMVARGFASHTYLHTTALALAARRKPCHVLILHDYDPSGVAAADHTERRLREYAPESEIHVQRLAVTAAQIEEWQLPTRPTKTTDSRSKRFGDDRSVELDAIPARRLRALVSGAIEALVDQQALTAALVAERDERRWLAKRLVTVARQSGSIGQGGN